MNIMSTYKRRLLAPLLFWHSFAAAFSFVFAYGLSFWIENLIQLIAIALLSFLLTSLFIFWMKIVRPLRKITNEMKALLTGKTYRKIMTIRQDEVGIIAHFFNEVTRNFENLTTDIKSHKRIQKELNMAQKIQKDLLPKNIPNIPHLDIVAKTRPASEIGGDTFDFFMQENRSLMYIGDSTGHGIPAGIVMVMVDVLLETFIDLYHELDKIIISLNKYLKPHLQTTMFMTMIFLSWEHETKKLSWVGAGHEHIIHMQTTKGQIQVTPAGGIAVGMIADNSALTKIQSMQLEENDFIVLYSDGITEAKNKKKEIYGLERLKNFIFEHASVDTSSDELFQKIAIDVGKFMNDHIQEDDMTLIILKQIPIKKQIPAES
jgi:sigma-B regulation protein RsbU (phosphoserine phosphatase)